jgi:hypothetical protein
MSDESVGAITETMISWMKQTSSWIRFLSILGFVYAGLIIVPSLLIALLFPLVDSFAAAFTAESGMPVGVFSIVIIFFVLVIGLVIIFPLMYLRNYGSKLRTYVQTNNTSALELAFKNNKSFWKFCGILTIISYALIPVSIIFVIGVLHV